MKQILRFWLLNRVIKNPILSAEIYQMMYQNRLFVRQPKLAPEQNPPTVNSVSNSLSGSSRRRELLAALSELKSKPLKTKQDKESIGVLEAALKNVN